MDPFASLSIAAAVIQFIDFGSKLVSGTYEIYRSLDGLTDEISELSSRTGRLGALASSLASPSAADENPASPLINSNAPKGLPESHSQHFKGAQSKSRILDTNQSGNKYGPDHVCRKLTHFAASLDIHAAANAVPSSTRRSQKETALLTIAVACKTAADELHTAISKLSVDKKSQTAFNSFRQALASTWGKRKLKNMECALDKYRSELTVYLVAIIRYVFEKNHPIKDEARSEGLGP